MASTLVSLWYYCAAQVAANLLPVFPCATISWVSRHHMRASAPAEHEEFCLWHHAPETETLNPAALRTGGLKVLPCDQDTENKARHVLSPQHRASLMLVCRIHSGLARPLTCSCHPDARVQTKRKTSSRVSSSVLQTTYSGHWVPTGEEGTHSQSSTCGPHPPGLQLQH